MSNCMNNLKKNYVSFYSFKTIAWICLSEWEKKSNNILDVHVAIYRPSFGKIE